MKGRIESQFKTEKAIEQRIENECPMLKPYYYSIDYMTHVSKKSYISFLINFIKYCKNELKYSIETEQDCSIITKDDIARFIHDYGRKPDGSGVKSPKTIDLAITILKAYFGYLTDDKEVMPKNPVTKIGRPQLPKKEEIIALTPEEIQQMFYNIDNTIGEFKYPSIRKKWKSRDRAFFALLLTTGVRETAMFEANMEDLNLEEKWIELTDKGNKTRKYDLDDNALEILYRWLRTRKRILEGQETSYLFFSLKNGSPIRLDTSTMNSILKAYTEFTGKNITCHKLRSTGGTLVYKSTKDIYKVADFLNHSNVATSQIYAKQDEDNRKKAGKMIADIIVKRPDTV